MPIRFVDSSSRLGRVQSALADSVAALAGTHVAPPARSGIFVPQLDPFTSQLAGSFQATADRLGILVPTLGNATADFDGSVSSPGLAEDSLYTLNARGGEDFGPIGPTTLIYEDFRNGVIGQSQSASATVGTWTTFGGGGGMLVTNAQFMSQGRSGLVQTLPNRWCGMTFPDTNMIRFSMWVRANGNPYLAASSWKMFWLMSQGQFNGSTSDLCFFTQFSNSFSIAGNSHNFQLNVFRQASGTNWLAANEWSRFTAYIDATNPGSVDINLQCLSQSFGHQNRDYLNRSDFFDNGQVDFDTLNINSYSSQNCPDLYSDNIYIATGAGAGAKVEHGENQVYSSCIDLHECTPVVSWAPSQIQYMIRGNPVGRYWHVHDANGVHTFGGIGVAA